MNANLRTCTAIALLAICGTASSDPTGAGSAHQYGTSALPLSEPDIGAGLHKSVTRSETGLARLAGNAATALTENATPKAGGRGAASARLLTLRQKRIFVLGLAAQEKK